MRLVARHNATAPPGQLQRRTRCRHLPMTPLWSIAWRSAWHRRLTLSLVGACIALASLLLLSLERLRHDVRSSFSQAVSGTDLVVGARTGPVQLMLYAVFRIGGATNNIGMDSLKAVAAHRAVAWLVPISLGDSHRGRPVVGTTPAYFERFRYGERQPLDLAEGRAFAGTLDGLYEAVVGAEVAQSLGYRLGQRLTLSHGSGALPGTEHADKPFTVVGVLAPTGTPVDRSVHVSLQAIEAIHLDWAGGAPLPGVSIAAEQARKFDLEPKQVTAALVGLKSRAAVFVVQRWVADYEGEPLLAVLPGVALDELWQVLGVGEQALQLMTALVAVVSLASLVAVVLAGLEQRRRELAVLRAVGAAPRHVLALLAIEGAIVTTLGTLAGALGSAGLAVLAAPWLQQAFGIQLTLSAPTAAQWGLFAATLAAGMLAALLPGVRAYRLSLADGLSPPT
jgi:putative ABC transport system permease protein